MLRPNHILSLLTAIIMLTILPWGEAKAIEYEGRLRPCRMSKRLSIGFERQVYSIYRPGTIVLTERTKKAAEQCSMILVRMKLTSRFRLETGLSYKDIDRLLSINSRQACINMNGPCSVSVPLTIQYQLLNERSRIHPYFGAGIQYSNYTQRSITRDGRDIINDPTITNSVKYMSIIFTQGLIYDVTPNLQITQSIHILPENGMKPIGINLGIGYRLR
jgi:hypothetical protein